MPTNAQKLEWYGLPGKNLVKVITPWHRPSSTGPKPITVYCHKRIAKTFLNACEEANAVCKWKPLRIDSYANRPIRGSTTSYSQHAFGLAFDFFNRPWPAIVDVWGAKNAPTPQFRAIFEKHGFTCGANWTRRPDYPHIEWRGPF